jgi:uncharacterized membrane protein
MMSVRDKGKEINVADLEHMSALVSGSLMLLGGFRKRGPLGGLMKIGGLAMIYRGQQGYTRLHRMLGITMRDVASGIGKYNVRVEAAIDIERPASELYRIWRNLENLPVFMDHLVSVHEVDDLRSIWGARVVGGMVVKWDAEIINDVENKIIAWQSMEGSGIDQAGSVRFEEKANGVTQIRVVLRYDPPAEALGYWLAKLLGSDPQRQINRDLRQFKEIMEAGSLNQ